MNPRRRIILYLLVIAGLFECGRAPAQAEVEGLCGTKPGLDQLLREVHERNVAARAKSGSGVSSLAGGLGDRIQSNLLVLEDDGDLVVGNVTDTLEIVGRAVALAGDRFDFITILTAGSFPGNISPESGFAFFDHVNNDVSGIGLPAINDPALTVLRGFVNMNDLDEYPGGPTATLAGFNGVVSGIEVLGQEAGHWAEAYISASGAQLLGRDAAHWNFYMNTYGSVMEGNLWVDNGDGTFTTAPVAQQFDAYSDLDLYLWGLLPAGGVTQPVFVITNPTVNPGQGRFSFPQGGFTTGGTRTNIPMSDILSVNGSRNPSYPAAPDKFTMAFVLVVPFGQQPTASDLMLATQFRATWEDWFHTATRGRGSFTTTIPDIPVTGDFSANPRAGGPAPLTVQFDSRLSGTVSGVLWDFGDGTTSTEPNPSHTYQSNRLFTVRLRIDGVAGPVFVEKTGFIAVGNFSPILVDDFEAPGGWTTDPLDTATGGWWERGDPAGTITTGMPVQPEDDHTPAPGTLCYVTGAAAGASPGANDVDGGVTRLLSPLFSLVGMENAWLGFAYWYTNDLGTAPASDQFLVELSNDAGANWSPVESIGSSLSRWRPSQVRLGGVLPASSQMQVRFTAADLGANSLVEAAVDDIAIIALPLSDQDLDGVTDGVDNCRGSFNPGQLDSDSDGPGDACDCAPTNPAISARPGEVPVLNLGGTSQLAWSAISQASGYDLYRGLVGSTQSGYYTHTCLATDIPNTFFGDPASPPAGSSYYYLVAGRNCFGQGTTGADSKGTTRPVTSPCL